jgi:hypothetical protein
MLDYSRLQRLARYKHYSLLGSFISYKKWSVANTIPDFYCHAGCHYPECRYVKGRGSPRFISLKKDEKCWKRKEEINIFFSSFQLKIYSADFFSKKIISTGYSDSAKPQVTSSHPFDKSFLNLFSIIPPQRLIFKGWSYKCQTDQNQPEKPVGDDLTFTLR